MALFHQKHQCPITAVVGQNDQFSDSTYHRRPEPEPDIESGLQGHLLIPLLRLQTLTSNDLVCVQQHCLYSFFFSIKHRTKIMGKTCYGSRIPARTFIFKGTIRYVLRMTYAALERPQNQSSSLFWFPFDF